MRVFCVFLHLIENGLTVFSFKLFAVSHFVQLVKGVFIPVFSLASQVANFCGFVVFQGVSSDISLFRLGRFIRRTIRGTLLFLSLSLFFLSLFRFRLGRFLFAVGFRVIACYAARIQIRSRQRAF